MLRRFVALLAALLPADASALDITVDTLVDHGTQEEWAEWVDVGNGTAAPVTLTVENPGTELILESWMEVGADDAARVEVLGGANLYAAGQSIYVGRLGGSGEIIVDGADTRLSARRVYLGENGADARLEITNGAYVNAVVVDVSREAGSSDGTVSELLVSGSGSRLRGGRPGVRSVGDVRVEDGGWIDTTVEAAGGSQVVVTGTGSRVNGVVVGSETTDGTLVVEDGASVVWGVDMEGGTATFRTGAQLMDGFVMVIDSDSASMRFETGATGLARILRLRSRAPGGVVVDVADGGVFHLGTESAVPAGIAAGTLSVGAEGTLDIAALGAEILGNVLSDGEILLTNPYAGGVATYENSTLEVSGDLTLLSGSELWMSVLGLVRGSEYDTLAVGGTAVLDGALSMYVAPSLLDLVGVGDTFTLLESGSTILGAFDNAANGDFLRFDFVTGWIRFQVSYGAASSFDPSQVILSVSELSTERQPGVPEPSILALLSVASMAWLSGRPRRCLRPRGAA